MREYWGAALIIPGDIDALLYRRGCTRGLARRALCSVTAIRSD